MTIWIPRVVMVRTIEDKAGIITSRHRHNYVQAGYVTSGRITVHLDENRTLHAGPNEFFCVAQHQPHIIENLPDKNTLAIDLRFQAVAGEPIMQKIRTPDGNGLDELARFSFTITRPHAKKIRRSLDEMIVVTQSQSGEAQNFLLGVQLLSLAQQILDLPRENRYPLKEEPQEHHAVNQAVTFIRENIHRPIDLDTLADHTGLSTGHLTRLFRRFTGLSPKQYILRHRIDQAKRLILACDIMPLKEVAYRTGFSDLQQFSRAFHRIEGCSPSRYFE